MILEIPCKEGDVVNLSGSWGVEKYMVYTINRSPPSWDRCNWLIELIPINDDDFYHRTRRVKVTDIDLTMYNLEISVVRKFGETNAHNDQEVEEAG